MFIQLKNQIGLVMGLQNLPEVVLKKGVGTAFEGCQKDGVEPFGLNNLLCRLENLLSEVPVYLLEKAVNGGEVAGRSIQHILIKDPDALGSEDFRYSLVHSLRKNRIGPAQKDNVGLFIIPAPPLYKESLQALLKAPAVLLGTVKGR